MNEIEVAKKHLPDTIQDLAKFALVGREQLNAVRAAIRAIDKVGLAKEVREQKLAEGQEIAEAVLDAEVRIGELLKETPKAPSNQYAKVQSSNGEEKQTPKEELRKEAGISKSQAFRFQTMAEHPEIVAQVKQEAREDEKMVSRKDILDEIRRQNYPAVTIKDYCEQAEQSHEDFKEQKVVTVEELHDDKKARAVIAYGKIYKTIQKVAGGLFSITINFSGKDLKSICEAMESGQRKDSITNLHNIINEANTLIKILEGKNGK